MDELKPAAADLAEQALYKAAEAMRRKRNAMAQNIGHKLLSAGNVLLVDVRKEQREYNTLHDAEMCLRSLEVHWPPKPPKI